MTWRRSGVNERNGLEERPILPQLKDAMEDVLKLLEAKEPHCFADAFKNLQVRSNEQRFLSGTALGSFCLQDTVVRDTDAATGLGVLQH